MKLFITQQTKTDIPCYGCGRSDHIFYGLGKDLKSAKSVYVIDKHSKGRSVGICGTCMLGILIKKDLTVD